MARRPRLSPAQAVALVALGALAAYWGWGLAGHGLERLDEAAVQSMRIEPDGSEPDPAEAPSGMAALAIIGLGGVMTLAGGAGVVVGLVRIGRGAIGRSSSNDEASNG